MKILFLDIDGVLVPEYQKVNDQAFSKNNPFYVEPFSKGAMDVLNNIIMTTNCQIVVSSGWRKYFRLQEIRDIFDLAGVLYGSDIIIGFTPTKRIVDDNFKVKAEEARAKEILDWVHLHKPEKWVAVDDLDLSPCITDENFVRCRKPMEGLKQCGLRNKIETLLK